MKRFLAVVLAVAMVAAFVPVAVADDPPEPFELDKIADGTVTTGDGWSKDATTITITATGSITLSGNSGGLGVNVTQATNITLAAGTEISVTTGDALQVPANSKITGGGNVTISSTDGYGIYVNGNVTIAGHVDKISGAGAGIRAANIGNIEITGNVGEITAMRSDSTAEGISAGSVMISGTVGNISGTGGGNGIGISTAKSSGSVTISGTVGNISGTSSSGSYGTGIFAGRIVTISGTVGSITGTGNSDSWGIDTNTLTISNNSVVYASSVMKWNGAYVPLEPTGSQGILFVGDTGTVYGNVTLKDDLTITGDQTLTVPTGASLTVPNDWKLTNNGEIKIEAGGLYKGELPDGDFTCGHTPSEADCEECGICGEPLDKSCGDTCPAHKPPETTDTTTTTETSETSFLAYFEPTPPAAPPVSDADTPSDWAKAAVEQARKLGLVPEHLDGSWRRWLNRAEFAAFAVLLYEHLDGRAITAWSLFDDTTDVNVEKLAGLGIVKGDGTGKFNPDGNFSREMALTLMYNIMIKLGYYLPSAEPNFSDADSISPWAREAIGALQRAGIIKGDGTRFNAQETFSREMGVVTMAQILEWVG